ncbi:GumC family protein [Zunongwangia pacifica]|uniref:non-specific protein-tyrosine kinase n=1 Tax=Zunongwangia pacifica TaxID=2911062 RepID=A0A9X2CJU4_9FLAO|nr:tyrosine-protein kinase family protein [Zunongwangia pacifica]MCL6216765.1 polysaccharide biosynthesis tyrosine autokinase [Zunongwangia pacifica]
MNENTNFQEEEINIREELEKYLKYWPWFVMSAGIALILAFFYLKLATPIYSTTASIIIKDEDTKSPATSGLSSFADLGVLEGLKTSSIENEIGLLESKRMMTKTIKSLDLNIQYYYSDFLITKELYKNNPFKVSILSLNDEDLNKAVENEINFFTIKENKEGFEIYSENIDKKLKGKFGDPLNIGFADIVIRKNTNYIQPEKDSGEFSFKISNLENIVAVYKSKLKVALVDDNSTLIDLSLDDHIPAKAQDILDQLIVEYNKEAIIDKNLVASNTAEFIDERLKVINSELDSVEINKEEFKEDKKLTDIKAESEIFLNNASDFKKERQRVTTQSQLAKAMLDFLQKGDNSDLLPMNLGIEGEGVNQQISDYNELVLQRNRILESSTEKNPVIKNLDRQINQTRSVVTQSLQRLKSNLDISLNELENESELIQSRISDVPSMERTYRGIDRQQQIKEALYLFLLQKREENSLSLAVTAPKAKIVDNAYTNVNPVAPKSKLVLLGGLVIGLLIPFGIIYGKNLLNNKVKNRGDLERKAKQIPIVGEIPRIDKKENHLITEADRSVLAESFRIAITNMQYLLINKTDKQKGIKMLVTSTVKGEGKTFTSINLALTLANMGKKVIVVGADLRNPQLQRYDVGSRKHLGVSDYLINEDLQLNNLIEQTKFNKNLDFLTSGSIPPNPSELLRHRRLGEMLGMLEEQYDYIILDTAPCMLVADTFLISQYADITLYVVRASYTEKALLQFPIDSKEAGKLHDISFVLNDVDTANFGYYGNKYGYSYGYSEDESFIDKIKKYFD